MLNKLFRRSLAFKLTAIMTLVVVFTLSIAIGIYIYLEKDFARTSEQYQFSFINREFEELISYTSGKDHSIQPGHIIEKLGENASINFITIYDTNGKPVLSSVSGPQKSLSPDRLKQLEELSNNSSLTISSKKTLDYIAPIKLRVSCQRCHTNGTTMGFIKISASHSAIYFHTYDMAKKFGFIFLSSLIIFALISVFASEFMVIKPLKDFVALIHKAELNNFLPRTIQTREDEIGEIEDNFNQMLSRITNLMATSVERERELVFVKEELKYKELLEKRSEQIERVNNELEGSVKELSMLYNFGQYIISTVDMNELLRIITTAIVDTLNYKECAILFKEDNLLRIVSAWGFEDNARLIGIEFGLEEGISGAVASTGKPLLINDTSKESRYLHYKGQTHKEGSFLSVPLKYKNIVIGVLNVSNDMPGSLTKKDIDFLTAISAQIAVVIENARLYEQTKELSITDDLTGLFNRRHMRVVLDKEWERSNRYHQPLSLLMIDLDLFKAYNDRFGHLKGDEALAIVSQIIRMNIRGIDVPIRYGGEEFLIILPDTPAAGALATAEKLRKAIGDAFTENNTPMLTISLGAVSYPEQMFETIHEFLYASDVALYEAKRKGRNITVKYDGKSMQENNT